MALTGKQRRHLRALAHHLDPVVLIGTAGISDALVSKVREELLNHELIKARYVEMPEDRKAGSEQLAAAAGADLVQLLGKTVVLYKRHPKEPKINLPKDK